ncbi:MAG TPA: CotH kinase family protein, partial [Polyangiaceae bacterium]|nr:CotH kinase family protein [Polyangiaceae bacterium]
LLGGLASCTEASSPGTGGSSPTETGDGRGASAGHTLATGGSSGGSPPMGTAATEPGGRSSNEGGGDAAGGRSALGGRSSSPGGGRTQAGGAGSAGALITGGTWPGSRGTGGSSGVSSGGVAGSSSADASAEIYDPTQLPRFDIELSDASIKALNAVVSDADPKQNEYVHASLRYRNELMADVGLRIKGEGSFRRLDKKTAFKLKIDEYVDQQSFHGLRRLTLNNMVEDPSFLAERLAYDLYRAAGLPAPRCNSALVYVNGDFYGVYANVEAEDKTFLSRWFASNAGNLYEEGQADFVTGAELAFDLETNETANDRRGLEALIAAVQSAPQATFLADIDGSLNTQHFLRFTAAEAAVNQWDMYSYTMFYPNNFRLYENPSDRRFVFLPWGMDMSMKPFRDSGRPHLSVFGIARQGDSKNGSISAGILFRKCLDSPACKAAYAEEVRQIAEVYEQADLGSVAGRYYAQIKASVQADPRKEYTNAQFEQGYQVLLKTISERPAALRADID